LKKRKRILITASFIVLFAVSLSESRSQQKKAEISFVVGKVFLKRNGKIIEPGKGDRVLNGDIFRLLQQSVMEFSFPEEKRKLRIRGPKIFRFNLSLLNKKVKRGSAATGFTKLLAKNSPPYLPRTIVSAVRGREDYRKKKALNRTGKRQLEKAVALMGREKYIDAWELLNKIEKINGLNSHAKAIVNFYRGEIRFREMEYDKALSFYLAASKYKRRKFRHREESYVRAVICADLIGKNKVLSDLVSNYEKDYGERGRYMEILREYK
jgi:tetratricopeptide (TPR) repeat protein